MGTLPYGNKIEIVQNSWCLERIGRNACVAAKEFITLMAKGKPLATQLLTQREAATAGTTSATIADLMNESALALFGGGERVFRTLSASIARARKKARMSPLEVGRKADLSDPSMVARFEKRTILRSKVRVPDVISILTSLGLSVSNLLTLSQPLSAEEVRFWNNRREDLGERPWLAARIPAGLDPIIVLNLFIRIQALEELFGSGRISRTSAKRRP